MEYPPKQIEQIEVIERSVIESRRPISVEEALNYHPISQTRTSTERYLHKDPLAHDGKARLDAPTFPPIDTSNDRYYLTGEREKDTSILYNSNLSPPTASAIADRSYGDGNDMGVDLRDRSYSSGINNYGYDLHEVQTSGGGAHVLQTHGYGNAFTNEVEEPLNDGSFVVHDRSLNTSTVLQSVGNSGVRFPPASPIRPSSTEYRESFSREVQRTISHSPSRLNEASGFPYLTAAAALPADLSQTSEQLHSILKNADGSKRYPSSEDNSMYRKDSYRRMQEGQDAYDRHTSSLQVPSSNSNAGSISKSSSKQWTFANDQAARHNKIGAHNDMFSNAKTFFSQNYEQLRNANWTPRRIGTLILVCLLVFLLLLISWLIFNSFFSGYFQRSFLLYPPVCEECLKRNPSAVTYKAPSELHVHLSSPVQAHFEIIGNLPFKSNSFTAVDFYTGYVAIADHALTDENGQHTTCFIMELDRKALPDMDVLIDALDNSYHDIRTQFGWQEYWQYNAEPVDELFARDKFRETIDDCEHAKWYFLRHTVYTKDSSCSTCYDFCLPDYAVLRRQKYEDEPSLGVRRLNCFRLYVPEWSRYSVQTDESGGHWLYPKRQLQQQQLLQRPNIQARQLRHHSVENEKNDERATYNLVGHWVEAGA